ncbi:MAG: flavin reductase family protein [Bacteroidota bacterium]|nr:flavin reductase family protein [Bacteroidota bacterium]
MSQSNYLQIEPASVTTAQFHEYLLGTIAPRPIAWASTIDLDGKPNLAPFSFFNVFGSNPATLIFSPSRRVRDNTTKHTLQNAEQTGEVVINIVSYAQLGNMVLSSGEFPNGVNEFTESGLEMLDSVMVKPKRVADSPAQFECKVRQIIETGQTGGAGQLILCDVLMVHLRDDILTESGKIDPVAVDGIARLGGLWYCRAKDGLFEVPNPRGNAGIGYSSLPAFIKENPILTGSDISRLATTVFRPSSDEIEVITQSPEYSTMHLSTDRIENISRKVQSLIGTNQLELAWSWVMTLA